MTTQHTPTAIRLHKTSNCLELEFGREQFRLPAEYLRVLSPSAEVRGHGNQSAVLQHGKQEVRIVQLAKSGNYALQITFDDGHDSGIYTWDYLYQLGKEQEQRWQQYVEDLHQAGKTRAPNAQVIQFSPPPSS